MRALRFSFKSEALWLLWLLLIPFAFGLVAAVLIPWIRALLGWQ